MMSPIEMENINVEGAVETDPKIAPQLEVNVTTEPRSVLVRMNLQPVVMNLADEQANKEVIKTVPSKKKTAFHIVDMAEVIPEENEDFTSASNTTLTSIPESTPKSNDSTDAADPKLDAPAERAEDNVNAEQMNRGNISYACIAIYSMVFMAFFLFLFFIFSHPITYVKHY